MNRSTVWKIVKKFQNTGNTLDQPGRGRKRSVRSLNSSKHEGKNATKPSPNLQNLGHRSLYEQILHAPVLRDDLRVTPLKMLHRQELTANVKLIFENFGIPSLKVEIKCFQMVIILRKLTILKGFYRKTKIGCLNSWTLCTSWTTSI